jgi:predicted DNA-binding transcriptional regulator AlpA
MKENHPDVFLAARQVRDRYGGVSDMSLWRWLHDDRLGFPKPLRIHNRRFWRLSDLRAWEVSQAVSDDGGADD